MGCTSFLFENKNLKEVHARVRLRPKHTFMCGRSKATSNKTTSTSEQVDQHVTELESLKLFNSGHSCAAREIYNGSHMAKDKAFVL